jgi:hypothetical protein
LVRFFLITFITVTPSPSVPDIISVCSLLKFKIHLNQCLALFLRGLSLGFTIFPKYSMAYRGFKKIKFRILTSRDIFIERAFFIYQNTLNPWILAPSGNRLFDYNFYKFSLSKLFLEEAKIQGFRVRVFSDLLHFC